MHAFVSFFFWFVYGFCLNGFFFFLFSVSSSLCVFFSLTVAIHIDWQGLK